MIGTAEFDERRWQQRLEAEIPLARALALQVCRVTPQTMQFGAPLSGNTNDKGSAFAGSLYSVAVLAGWALLSHRLEMEHIGADVMIHESSVHYTLPVHGEFLASANLPESTQLDYFLTALRRARKARLPIAVHITYQDKIAMTLSGSYVAVPRVKK